MCKLSCYDRIDYLVHLVRCANVQSLKLLIGVSCAYCFKLSGSSISCATTTTRLIPSPALVLMVGLVLMHLRAMVCIRATAIRDNIATPYEATTLSSIKIGRSPPGYEDELAINFVLFSYRLFLPAWYDPPCRVICPHFTSFCTHLYVYDSVSIVLWG